MIRHPDENHEAVHRWLLERNLRLYGVSYAIDRSATSIWCGRLPLAAVTPDEVDRLLGSVLEAADGAFNSLLELGFADAIARVRLAGGPRRVHSQPGCVHASDRGAAGLSEAWPLVGRAQGWTADADQAQ